MKHKLLTIMFFACCLLLTSCNKEKQGEWNNFSQYTMTDLIGDYSYSHVDGAFDGLTEGELCHICDDADISVTSGNGSKLQFAFRSVKGNLVRTISGSPKPTDDSFLIYITESGYQLTANVYKDKNGRIRLHGYVRRANEYGTVNYYFDVIKN